MSEGGEAEFPISACLDELWQYYQNCYYTINAFQTSQFSGSLRHIAELTLAEELQPNCNSFWNACKETFVLPDVYINGEKIVTLIDTGASSSVMSIKLLDTIPIKSLQLVFKANTRIMKMANNNEIRTQGQLLDVPVEVNQNRTTANPHVMGDLSYDLILGRDWCEANGIILDFSKKKLYFLQPQDVPPELDFVCQFDDRPSPPPNDCSQFAQLEIETLLQPFHETKVVVRSKQNATNTLFVQSNEPMVTRFGVFVVKGLVQFENNLATIILSNLTNNAVTLPPKTIVANLQLFNEDEWTSYDPFDHTDGNLDESPPPDADFNENYANLLKNRESKKNASPVKDRRQFLILEKDPNQFVHWKPILKQKQNIIINKSSKVVRFVDIVVTLDEGTTDKKKPIENLESEPTIHDQPEISINESNLQASSTEKEPYQEVKIDEAYLTTEQLRIVKELLEQKGKVFASKNEAPGKALNVTHHIDTGNSAPVHQPKYRTSHQDRTTIASHIKDMLDKKIIEPSRSPWSSPIVLVPKKDGTIRFCVDYRKLNLVTKKDSYALPRIDEALALLNGNLYFSSLDCNAGYFQIPMEQSSKEKTAFITDQGLFQFNVMSFGLTNAPATFQRYMDAVLAGLKWNTLLVYIDDILVFSPTFEDHVRDVNNVLDRLLEANITLKPSKCNVFQKELLYLGHLVSADGIRPDPKKIQAILEMPEPVDVTTME